MIDDPIDEPVAQRDGAAPSVDHILGQRIRARRMEHGYSTAQLAQKIGISRERAEAIERGTCRPTALELAGLAATFQVQIEFFFDGLTDERSFSGRVEDGHVVQFPTKAS
jgi:transcriptional regulator with XRE-family HTH domain